MANIGHETTLYLSFALTTMVLRTRARLLHKGFPALARGTPDMNSLVATGTISAYLYSIVATFAPALLPAGAANVYYEAACVIVTLILFGRFMEARAKGRTSDAIRALARLQPQHRPCGARRRRRSRSPSDEVRRRRHRAGAAGRADPHRRRGRPAAHLMSMNR